MAKKRRNNHKPAPKNESKEKVIDQLFGTLESEPDIESDITDLGGDEPTVSVEERKTGKSRFFFGFAAFVIVMAIVGCISTLRFAVDFTNNLMDNTSLKNEFAQFIFPVVVNDIPPFENPSEIPNSSKITSAIWNILINKDTSRYEGDMEGLLIPEYDVMASCKEIFGSTVTIEHQSVGSAEVRFDYDPDRHVYSAAKNIRYLTYAPKIIDMIEENGNYTLLVGYLPPTVASVAELSGLQATPDKYMEYTINRWDGKDTLLSVRFSDYVPETKEAANP